MTNENDNLVIENHGPFGDYYVHPAKRERSLQLRNALAALETVEIIETELDGKAIPYYGEPEGVYRSTEETEDEMEMARR